MHLKESAYNFIYDDLGKDQIVFYNSRTGALAVVHEDQYKQYKGFQEKGKEIEDSSCDFFEDPKCKECKLLPVCMGGCPHSRVEGKTICHQLNFRMKDYLIEYTRTLVSTT